VFHYKQVTVNRDNWAEHHYRLLKSDKKYKIAIVIITNKRYDSLNKCITSILKQTTDQQFDLFIIDCDINKSANKIMNIKFPKHIQIYYSYEKNKNKSFIKNKIMNQIKYNYDYFTFIKDNQTVNDIWLDSLLSSSIKYNSDIMSGPVKFFTNSKTNENSFSSTRKNKTGDIIKKNDVRNIIIKGKIFNEIEKPFNENFKNIDDSYLHLLNIFSSKGYKIKWCDEAIIYEKLDKKKETLNWTLINHFRIEKAKFYSLKLLKNKMKLILFIFKNIIKIIFLILFFIIGIFFYFTPFKKYFLKKIKKLIECLGFLTAIFNFNR